MLAEQPSSSDNAQSMDAFYACEGALFLRGVLLVGAQNDAGKA